MYYMNSIFPTYFISHGAPSIVIDDSPARDFLRQLGKQIGRPKAIISISAHWTTLEPRVSMHPQPGMIYDFGGFPDELYSLVYPAPGDPVLAKRVISLLKQDGIAGDGDMSRGFDHGAWTPLLLMYPEADIPVIQLSVQPRQGPEHHFAIGKALQPLREEGILILASGSATHNLQDIFGRAPNAEPLPYAKAFAEWLKDAVTGGRTEELLDYENQGPFAHKNHPTPEHLLPLYVALAAGGPGRVIHDSFKYGVMSMAAFSWD
jgi:4,5-DOPA dioxygenase extradiol